MAVDDIRCVCIILLYNAIHFAEMEIVLKMNAVTFPVAFWLKYCWRTWLSTVWMTTIVIKSIFSLGHGRDRKAKPYGHFIEHK